MACGHSHAFLFGVEVCFDLGAVSPATSATPLIHLKESSLSPLHLRLQPIHRRLRLQRALHRRRRLVVDEGDGVGVEALGDLVAATFPSLLFILELKRHLFLVLIHRPLLLRRLHPSSIRLK